MSRDSRGGFTLIELIAGLALAGVVLTTAVALVGQLRDGRDQLLALAKRENKRENGIRVLRSLIARAEVHADSVLRFTGAALGAGFVTWCEVPSGWLERCYASLNVEQRDDSAFVRAQFSTGERVTLIAVAATVELRYYIATPELQGWTADWGRSAGLPVAVGVLVGSDTLVMRAGGRG